MKFANCNETYKGTDAQFEHEYCVLWWFHEGPHNSGHHKWITNVPMPPPVVLTNSPE